MTVTTERETCRLHPDGCRDSDRHPLSVKVRTDMKRAMGEAVADGAAETINAFAEEAIEARLGLVRCVHCHEAVPLVPGDLTGRPLDWWISEAVRQVAGQPHRDHQPVPLGAVKAASRAAHRAVAPRPAPGSAVFLEPGGRPVVTAAVPEVPASRNKKGRRR